VVETTTTYVVVKYALGVANSGSGSGGTISLNAGLTDTFKYLHTDCYAQVDVEGGQDIPVISAQVKNTIQYDVAFPSSLTYTAAINRYKLSSNSSFIFDATVAKQVYTQSLSSTTTNVVSLTITSGTKAVTTYPFTYSIVANAAGFDLKLDIFINASASAAYDNTNTTITITDGGYNWTVGDTVTIFGTDLGAASPANDLVLTVTQVGADTSNVDTLTYSTVFTPIKDQPQPGSYLYFLDTSYYDSTGQTVILGATLDYRSLTAQVIKE
jgi:hypothetical protein